METTVLVFVTKETFAEMLHIFNTKLYEVM